MTNELWRLDTEYEDRIITKVRKEKDKTYVVFPCGCSHLKVEHGLCHIYSDQWTDFEAPWLRSFPAEHVHRITLIDMQPAWTLVIVLASVREWGFWPRGRWVHWREYVKPGNAEADKAKSCP